MIYLYHSKGKETKNPKSYYASWIAYKKKHSTAPRRAIIKDTDALLSKMRLELCRKHGIFT